MKKYYLLSIIALVLSACSPRTASLFSDPSTIYFHVTNTTSSIQEVRIDQIAYTIYPNERRVIQFPIGEHCIAYKESQLRKYFDYRDLAFFKISGEEKDISIVAY